VNFFERQHAARGSTVKLVVLFTLGVLSVVAVVDVVVALLFIKDSSSAMLNGIIAATVVTVLVMTAGTVTKLISLRAGGAAVAKSVGAVAIDPSTSDPRLRRFVNVVEEMSIASGVPMPRLFVMDSEAGINAFAAGYSPSDAAVTVTAGALDRLNRDELQGVIGHEFSHILNGDMRLNVRLIGLLNGILLLGLIGLRFLAFGGGRSRDKNGNALAVVAIVFMVVGFLGQFFAGLIKAAVSRQREWLADASSVQFTRQTAGLAGALKKIAGLPAGSQLTDSPSEKQISHMLFGEGRRGLSQMYATHPPLLDRIKALEPDFQAAQVEQLSTQWAQHEPNGMAEDASLGLVTPAPARPAPSSGAGAAALTPAHVTGRVGTMTPGDLSGAGRLSRRIPASYRALVAQQSTAVPLVLAMLLDKRPEIAAAQHATIVTRLGPAVAAAVAQYAEQLDDLAPELRLPVVELAVPQLAGRPAAERATLVAVLDELARADGVISVFEYCLTRVVGKRLLDVADPVGRSRRGRSSVSSMRDAALALLSAVAAAGNRDPRAAEHAFTAAAATLLPGVSAPYAPPGDPWRTLDAGWDALRRLDGRNKQVLVESLVVAVVDDKVVTVEESELLRTVCALIDCPLPPLVA